MAHHKNFLLSQLDQSIAEKLLSDTKIVSLAQGDVLAEADQPVNKVYFPHSGIISSVVELQDGGAIEAGMIGRDGQYGAAAAFNGQLSLTLVTMQVAGEASVISGPRVTELAGRYPAFRKLLLSYEQFFLSHVMQTAACNAEHKVQKRMCKWLLRMHHLVGPELQITQEFMAQMMGVRRTSVSEVAGELQRIGLISYARGKLHIQDIGRVRQFACECDDDIQRKFASIFPRSDRMSGTVPTEEKKGDNEDQRGRGA